MNDIGTFQYRAVSISEVDCGVPITGPGSAGGAESTRVAEGGIANKPSNLLVSFTARARFSRGEDDEDATSDVVAVTGFPGLLDAECDVLPGAWPVGADDAHPASARHAALSAAASRTRIPDRRSSPDETFHLSAPCTTMIRTLWRPAS